MGKFFALNPGLVVPVVLIMVWLAASAVIRCSGYLTRTVRRTFSPHLKGFWLLPEEAQLSAPWKER